MKLKFKHSPSYDDIKELEKRIKDYEKRIDNVEGLEPVQREKDIIKREDRIFKITGWAIAIAGIVATTISIVMGFQTVNYEIKLNEIAKQQQELISRQEELSSQQTKLENRIKSYNYIIQASNTSNRSDRIEYLTNGIEIDPNNAILYYYRAKAYLQRDRDDSSNLAYEDCVTALTLDEQCMDARYIKAQIEMNKDINEVAYKDLNICYNNLDLLHFEKVNDTLYNLAHVAWRLGEHDDIIKLFKGKDESILDNRDELEYLPYYLLAEAYNFNGDYSTAIEYYSLLLEKGNLEWDELAKVCSALKQIYEKLNDEENYEKYDEMQTKYEKMDNKFGAPDLSRLDENRLRK